MYDIPPSFCVWQQAYIVWMEFQKNRSPLVRYRKSQTNKNELMSQLSRVQSHTFDNKRYDAHSRATYEICILNRNHKYNFCCMRVIVRTVKVSIIKTNLSYRHVIHTAKHLDLRPYLYTCVLRMRDVCLWVLYNNSNSV